MARIPDVTDLGARPIPRRARGIVSDRSGEISAQSLSNFGGAIGNIASAMSEREDRFAYAQAKSTLLQADIETRKALEDDNDWSTYETRYQETMGKAVETASKHIRGNRDRTLFGMDAKMDVERGLQEIRAKAKSKEIDWGRSTLDQMSEANRAAAISAADESSRQAIITAQKDAIVGAKDKGYLSEQEATDHFQRWRDSYAIGQIEMQLPTKRIEMLTSKGTAADYLQPDLRAKLLEAAKREDRDLTVRRDSQAQFDAIIVRHGTGSAAIKEARAIKDPEVRDLTESRIKQEHNRIKEVEREATERLGEEAIGFINGGGKFADMPLRIKNGLKPSVLNSIRSYAEQAAVGAPRRTNPETLVKLSTLAADDPQAFGEANMMEYRAELSDGDFEEFVDLQRKIRSGNIDGKASGFQSITQVRDARLKELFGGTSVKGKKQADLNRFVIQFENELKAFKQETGRHPRAEDARKILDNLTAEVAINWGRDKKVFELDSGDIEGVPDVDRAEIIRELQKRGKPVTDKAILDLYRYANQ